MPNPTTPAREGYRPVDTCDGCPECQDEANWDPCCASCHCATSAMRCPDCRTTKES